MRPGAAGGAGAGSCGSGADPKPRAAKPVGEELVGSVAQMAQCSDWNGGTRAQRAGDDPRHPPAGEPEGQRGPHAGALRPRRLPGARRARAARTSPAASGSTSCTRGPPASLRSPTTNRLVSLHAADSAAGRRRPASAGGRATAARRALLRRGRVHPAVAAHGRRGVRAAHVRLPGARDRDDHRPRWAHRRLRRRRRGSLVRLAGRARGRRRAGGAGGPRHPRGPR